MYGGGTLSVPGTYRISPGTTCCDLVRQFASASSWGESPYLAASGLRVSPRWTVYGIHPSGMGQAVGVKETVSLEVGVSEAVGVGVGVAEGAAVWVGEGA